MLQIVYNSALIETQDNKDRTFWYSAFYNWQELDVAKLEPRGCGGSDTGRSDSKCRGSNPAASARQSRLVVVRRLKICGPKPRPLAHRSHRRKPAPSLKLA
jgi:hypothetical protein